MKFSYTIVLLFLIESSKSDKGKNDYNARELRERHPEYGTEWMYIPDGEGKPQKAILKHKDTKAQTRALDVQKEVTFRLYTRNNLNDPYFLEVGNTALLRASYYDPKKATKFVTHGWKSSGNTSTCISIKDAYLEHSDVNVIIVDWQSIADNIIYVIPKLNTKHVGRYLAQLINFLQKSGADTQNMHLIGHSLGAHVSAYAGEYSKGILGRITGLDPALPLFTDVFSGNEDRLDPSDASFVDVIHTCGGALGFYTALGHADFYPNGGTPSQPGCCCIMPEILEACSHGRSWQYFAESIGGDPEFIGVKCESWFHFEAKNCTDNMAPMGANTPVTARGSYYLLTGQSFPFAMGMDAIQPALPSDVLVPYSRTL